MERVEGGRKGMRGERKQEGEERGERIGGRREKGGARKEKGSGEIKDLCVHFFSATVEAYGDPVMK